MKNKHVIKHSMYIWSIPSKSFYQPYLLLHSKSLHHLVFKCHLLVIFTKAAINEHVCLFRNWYSEYHFIFLIKNHGHLTNIVSTLLIMKWFIHPVIPGYKILWKEPFSEILSLCFIQEITTKWIQIVPNSLSLLMSGPAWSGCWKSWLMQTAQSIIFWYKFHKENCNYYYYFFQCLLWNCPKIY